MILGIDLGTSNSIAAVYKDGNVHMIPVSSGGYVTPSVVNLDENGKFCVGEIAKNRKNRYPAETVDMFKRSMGSETLFTIGDMKLKAEELSAIVLKSIKIDAESYLQEEIADVVISVPAFFNNPQREAVLRAGELAGFNVKKIINEPTSAAMAYGMQCVENNKERVIMVLDLGGGTFDISIMEVAENTMEVIAICGDNNLGGNDFTARLVEAFLESNDIAVELIMEERSRLWAKAEKGKLAISDNGIGEICCEIRGNEYSYKVTEEEYEKLCFDLLDKIRRLTLRAVAESPYKPEEISDIIMVGGGTKLSIVKNMIERMMDKQIEYEINPDEAVVIGAAMQGALLEHNEEVNQLIMTDICPYYIMSITDDRRMCDLVKVPNIVINKNSTIPTRCIQKAEEYPGNYCIEIYQSEDIHGEKKIKIGECKYIVPVVKDYTCEVVTTAYYDNNGILKYDIYIPAVKKTYETIIVNSNNSMDKKQVAKYIDDMNKLVFTSYSEDDLVMAQAEALYAEVLDADRSKVNQLIIEYEEALKTGKKSVIKEARDKLKAMIKKFDI